MPTNQSMPDMPAEKFLPGFIVVGAMRAGTTTLYHLLAGHPDIGMSRTKETDFFIPKMNYPLGLDWYRSQFDPGFPMHGEVSPNYAMCHLWQGVPERIHETLPRVKLIFIARDPVDRFVSHYLHGWHMGYARIPPEALLGSENGHNMLKASQYATQIEAYLQHFPSAQILILDFDELRTDPQATMDRVTDFLELDRHTVGAARTKNDIASIARLPGFVQRAWRSRFLRRFDHVISRDMRDRARHWLSVGPRRADPEIGPELRKAVADQLEDDTAAFRRLSGQDFPGWQI